eukprot:GHRQ01007962.1.p1 GENE.GHRQ01007962.1~~GHRQ01007962.1.p1  ORF type:complete len:151 (+),score=37.41 GHRQ01007962.1:926-1378(+)
MRAASAVGLCLGGIGWAVVVLPAKQAEPSPARVSHRSMSHRQLSLMLSWLVALMLLLLTTSALVLASKQCGGLGMMQQQLSCSIASEGQQQLAGSSGLRRDERSGMPPYRSCSCQNNRGCKLSCVSLFVGELFCPVNLSLAPQMGSRSVV